MNLLVRDIPDEVVAALDAEAARKGLSRSEYLRRTLTQLSRASERTATVEDLTRFEQTFRDLDDPDVMEQAWR
jgi:plasmid stability protein